MNTMLVKESDSYSYNNDVQNIYKDKADIRFSSFYGDDTIWIMKADKDNTVDIKYAINISSGKFKLILIDPNDKVTVICEGSGNSSKTLDLPKGKNRIKIVGSAAKGKVSMELELGDGVSVIS